MTRVESIPPIGEEAALEMNDNDDSSPPVVFDLSALNANNPSSSISANRYRSRHRNGQHGDRDDASVATTAQLASSVGSVMMSEREAFMKSFTFWKNNHFSSSDNNLAPDNNNTNNNSNDTDTTTTSSSNLLQWDIEFAPPIKRGKGGMLLQKKQYLPIANISGILTLSRIRKGDYLKSINGRTVGSSLLHPERARERLQQCLEQDGYLCITTKNKEEGVDDILVHATIVKPKANLTCAQMGLTVWFWGYLCIREIAKDSMLQYTALKETDQIISINEISCHEMRPKEFETVFKQLPRELTITVLRRKERVTGKFG